jgi:glutathione S-transferase
MITVHHLGNSHSHVVLWLMEELGAPYELVRHERDPQTGRAPDSLRAIHPAGKAPTIVDHGLAMIESAGVVLYLLDAYGEGRLRPAPNTPEAMTFFQWLTYIEGSAKAPLMQLFGVDHLPADNPGRRHVEHAAATAFGLLDAALEGQETLVTGQFTAADIQLAFFEELMEAWGRIGPYPNLQRHLGLMRERQGYRRAEARGGPVGQKALFERILSRRVASGG